MNRISEKAIINRGVEYGLNNWVDCFCVIGAVPCHTNWQDHDLLKGVKIGDNNYFYSGVHVVRGTKQDTVIRDNCIIGQIAIIGHDSIIDNNCRIMNGCKINGWVTIGENTFLGTGSIIRNRIKIGSNCYVGQGSNVVKDIPDNSFGYGNPFRVIRKTDNDLVFNMKRVRDWMF